MNTTLALSSHLHHWISTTMNLKVKHLLVKLLFVWWLNSFQIFRSSKIIFKSIRSRTGIGFHHFFNHFIKIKSFLPTNLCYWGIVHSQRQPKFPRYEPICRSRNKLSTWLQHYLFSFIYTIACL